MRRARRSLGQRRRRGARRSRPPGEFRTPVLEGCGAGGNDRPRRSAPVSARARGKDGLGCGARTRRRQVQRDDPHARPRLGSLLCLGPVADRGLLRRQQADERLHRLRQYRYQFAPVHGVLRRRAQARLRLRHGARLLRGSGTRRPCRARRLQSRLVPSRALPAHRRRQGEAAGDEGGADRSAPHGHSRHRRPPPADQARRRRAAISRVAALSRAQLLDQAQLHQAAHDRLQGGGACSRHARPLRPRASHGASCRDAGEILRAVCRNGEDRHRL